MYRFIRITSFLHKITTARNLGRGEVPVKMTPLIVLTTDFGLRDPYVGVMKGVILGICPGATLVDLTHEIAPQDVIGGILALESARRYFPRETVHVVVVDPGVGSAREAVAVATERDVFLAPDNGLLSFLRDDEIKKVWSIRNPALMLHPVSRTFHGRDVFAPVAAHLARGVPLAEVGPCLAGIARLQLPEAVKSSDGVEGEILTFDRFGNAITAVRERDLPAGDLVVSVAGRQLPLVQFYSAVSPGEALSLVGSSGRLELSVQGGSARESLGLRVGMTVSVLPRAG